MKVTAVTPTDAASDPLHPDHDRWVKETTLAVEVAHAQRVGKTFRDAEAENAYWLNRAEAKAREAKPVPAAKPRPRKDREQRAQARGVAVRPGKIGPEPTLRQLSPCGRCGVCRACRRERRIYQLAISYKQTRDEKIKRTLDGLFFLSMQARDLTGPFHGMSRTDAERVLVRKLEDICDSTIPSMGEWTR